MRPDGGSRRRAGWPETVIVRYDQEEYRRDLRKCRRLLLQRQIETKTDEETNIDDMAGFAASIGISRSTLGRWLSGHGQGTMATTVAILTGLGLSFEDAHVRVDGSPDTDAGEAST